MENDLKPIGSSPNLKKNYFYNFISQILTLIVPLITTPYLSRILLEEGNGQYSFAMSIITIFMLFANMGFTMYGQREIAKCRDNIEDKSKLFWEIVILRLGSTIISLGVLFAVLFTIGFTKCNDLILIMSLYLVSSIFDVLFVYQGEEDFRAIAFRTILVKILGLIFIFIFIQTETDVWKYALCISGIQFFSSLIMWPPLFKRIKFIPIKFLSFKRHLLPTFYIFLPTLAVTIYSTLDKTMIGLLASNSDYENGCYEQAYKINSVALLLVTVISPVMIPRNSHDYQTKNFEAIKGHLYFASNYVMLLSFPLIAGFVALASNLCYWFLGDGYVEVPTLLYIMSIRLVLSGFSEVFGSQLFIAIGKEKYFTFATGAAALVNFGLNFWLIPQYGATGAAITTAISELICVSVLAIFVIKGKYLSLKKILAMSWKYIVGAVFMFITLFYLQKLLSYSVWTFILLTIIGCTEYGLLLFAFHDNFFITNVTKVVHFISRKVFKKK